VSTVGETIRDAVPEDAFALDVDVTTATVLAMLGTDALLWVVVIGGHLPMPGMGWLMDQGLPMAAPGAILKGVYHVGTAGAVLGYATMWGVMMWAMMHPAMTRFTREFADAHRGSRVETAASLATFMLGYHAVWTLSAAVPLTMNLVLPGGIYEVVRARPHLAIGGALTLTGLYQLSRFKLSRLRACCASVSPHRIDPAGAARQGLDHGVRCVLVSFGFFFLLMPVFGSMNTFWMVGLTTVVALERLPSWGREIAVSAGVVALSAGLTVIVARPALPVSFVASGGM
jgi:predicted metal-binding membrane protein